MYLVHGNVVKSWGYGVLPWVWGVVKNGGRPGAGEGREGVSASGVVGAWVLSVLLVMPVVVWLADLFWRVVDLRCVGVARWVEVEMSMSIANESDEKENVRS